MGAGWCSCSPVIKCSERCRPVQAHRLEEWVNFLETTKQIHAHRDVAGTPQHIHVTYPSKKGKGPKLRHAHAHAMKPYVKPVPRSSKI